MPVAPTGACSQEIGFRVPSFAVRGVRFTLCAVTALALAACPGRQRAAGEGDTVPDPHPPDFAPGLPLEAPPPPERSVVGYDYVVAAEPQLQGRWQGFLENCRTRLPADHPFNEASLVVTLELELTTDGELADVRVGDTSGNAELDRVALEVVRDAGRFPAPPAELLSDDGRLHLSWRFARDDRQAGAAGAAVSRIEWPIERAVPLLVERGELARAARRIERAAGDGGGGESALELLDTVAEAAVLRALRDDDVGVQRAALHAAATARLAAAVPRLRELATRAVELDLRALAVAGLGAVGDAQVVELLGDIVAGANDDEVRAAAARAMHTLGEGERAWQAVRPGLTARDGDAYASSLFVLAHFPAPEAVPELARALEGGGKRGLRLAAAAALGAAVQAAGNKASKLLLTCLEQRDAALRAACAQALADAARAGYQSRAAFWATAKLLTDADDRVRAAAAAASALLGKESFARELYRLRKETKPGVLAALADGLGAVPGEAALERLTGLAAHDEPAIRRAVARSLARRDEPAARALLASWTDAGDIEIRLLALAAVDDGERLRELAADDHPRVSAAALARLVALEGRGSALELAARLLAAAPSPAHRAVVAAGWLTGR